MPTENRTKTAILTGTAISQQPTPAAVPEPAAEWREVIQGAIDELPYQHHLIPRLVALLASAPAAPAPAAQEPIKLSDDVREFLREWISSALEDDDHDFANQLEVLLGPIYTAPPAAEQQGAQEADAGGWRDMDSAPKDATMLRLLVEFEDHATEYGEGPAATIGFNALENDQIDRWQFAGWCWTHDRFTNGVGTPIRWRPLVDGAEQPETVPVPRALLVEHLDEVGVYAWETLDRMRALLDKEGA